MSNVTPEGMLSFPHLWVAKPVTEGGEPRFSASLVIDQAGQASAAYRQLRLDVAAAIDEKFGAGKSKDARFIRTLRLPFRNATEKAYAGYDEGKVFISAWTKTKPGVVDGGTVNTKPADINAPSDVWAGQTARFTVTAFAYDKGANKGVGFMLNNVQITNADMPRMDGRKAAKDDFDYVPPRETVGAGAGADADDDEPPF